MKHLPIAVIGGGPAGLIAAETLATQGLAVTVYDQMPSLARKFLMAGRGGLNLTHSEALPTFLPRYGAAAPLLQAAIAAFPPAALRAWCEGLGEPTFVGSSGRVFPHHFKASPLLRAWLKRLQGLGVVFALRQCWQGWTADGALRFAGAEPVAAAATLLALGGASWPRLGSDGSWVNLLAAQGVAITPLRPANCGFGVPWSPAFRSRFAGQPLKPLALSFAGKTVQGEAMVTEAGLEGGAVYALAAALRDTIATAGIAHVSADLRPQLSEAALAQQLNSGRGSQSLSTYLRRAAGLSPLAVGLVQEALHDPITIATADTATHPAALARLIKNIPLRLTHIAAPARAISTAGGVAWQAVDNQFMLRTKPGVFIAGEMLDWEAPTGGYLLQACFSTGVAAAKGIVAYCGQSTEDRGQRTEYTPCETSL